MTCRAALAIVVALGASAAAGPEPDGDTPPASLRSGEPESGSALDPVFAYFKLDRLGCKFSEEKHVALLARPLRSTGNLYFERDKGIARVTVTPKPQQIVLTATSLRIHTGKRTEQIALDRSKDLKAFALIFPTLLQGDRAGLERAFTIGLYGSDRGWWALAFTPRAASLAKLVKSVVVVGRKSEVVSLEVVEASGDTTHTLLTDIRTNDDVPEAEIAKAFGVP